MSVDTKARLLGHIKPEEIVNYIYHNWDKNVNNRIERELMNRWKDKDFIKEKYDDDIYIDSGFIIFEYKKENRIIHYFYESYNSYENLNYYKQYCLENMVKMETTRLSLGCWGNSVEIMKELCEYFGGFLDTNDSDNKPYYYIPSTQPEKRKEFPPVIYMTQEELNKHFGGIVVIKD